MKKFVVKYSNLRLGRQMSKKRYENIVVKYSKNQAGWTTPGWRDGEQRRRRGLPASFLLRSTIHPTINQPTHQIHQKIIILYHYCCKPQPDHIYVI